MKNLIRIFLLKARQYGMMLAGLLLAIGLITASCHYVTKTKSIQSLIVLPSTATIEETATLQFHATVIYRDGSREKVTAQATWNSSNPAVASLGSDQGPSAGMATGQSPGTTTITAQYAGVTSRATTLNVVGIDTKKVFLYTVAAPTVASGETIGGGGVFFCSLNVGGGLVTCDKTTWDSQAFASKVSTDGGIALHPSGKYAYIANDNYTNGYIAICEIDQNTGNFKNCTNNLVAKLQHHGESTTPGSLLSSISFDDADTPSIYINEYSSIPNKAYKCTLSKDGSAFKKPSQQSCTQILPQAVMPPNPSPTYELLVSTAINPSNTFFYLTEEDAPHSNYWQCGLTSNSQCGLTMKTLTPSSLRLNALAFHQREQYAYISNTSNNALLYCEYNSNEFSNCQSKTLPNTIQTQPSYGLVFNPKNSNIYLTNTDHKIWYCKVDTNPSTPETCSSSTIANIGNNSEYVLGGLAITP